MSNRGFYSPNDYTPGGSKRKYDYEDRNAYNQPYRRPYRDQRCNSHQWRERRRSPSASHDSASIDDEVGHYHGIEGSMIRNRYRVIRELGKGTFGSVFKCHDSKHNDHVALKVIRSISRYIDSAKIEAELLDDIYDKQNAQNLNVCVKMFSHFRFGEHYCMVFETLGVSLYDLVKQNDYKRLPLYCVRDVARQLLLALNFLQSINMIHTDLKLENVLFTHNTLRKEVVDHGGKKYTVNVPVNTNIKLIDFGGATYDNDPSKSRIVNTRQYRSPEVTLELGWSFPSDVWSAGCIIAEVYSGDLLFDTHEELEHLALIEQACECFPRPMVDQSRHGVKYFDRHSRVRYSELAADSRRVVDSMIPLKRYFTLAPEDVSSGVADLVTACLRVDPHSRVTARQALDFAFLHAPPTITIPTSSSSDSDAKIDNTAQEVKSPVGKVEEKVEEKANGEKESEEKEESASSGTEDVVESVTVKVSIVDDTMKSES